MKLKFLLLLTLLAVCVSTFGNDPPRKKRSDSFLGIHMDFHANPKDREIGKNTTPELVNTILDIVKPDYIQVDCKGHRGISSYPTKKGIHGGSFVGDPLRVWRKVTAERGVALYMHYSGVWDTAALEKHPDWAVTEKNGKKSNRITSVFGPFADNLLIPQLIELANEYGVDGAWIDGECWATQIDWSDKAKKAFTDKTGIKVIPQKPDDPNWFDWCNFHRNAFLDYLRHYIVSVKEKAPNFQIASNWAFTDHMPRPVDVPVDFISGDYTPGNSVNAARFSSRYMQTQKTPWDLMAWSFDYSGGNNKKKGNKTGIQLCREAACVLAQGGGFQAYYTQNRDGSIDLNKIQTMGEAATFCRARQNVCWKSTAVPQVALLLPVDAHYKKISSTGEGLFPWAAQWQRGILNALLTNQYSVEICNETPEFFQKLYRYKTIVVCQWNELAPNTVGALVQFVKGGGTLLLAGEETIRLFDSAFKGAGRESIGSLPNGYTLQIAKLGAGKAAFIPQPLTGPQAGNQEAIQTLVGVTMKQICPDPDVTVTGSPFVDVSIRRTTEGKLAVNLVNVSGAHEAAGIIDKIDPVGPLAIEIQTGRRPAAVTVEPGNRKIDWTWQNGKVKLTLNRLDIHDIVLVDDRALNADWMKEARYGCFMHFLPGSPEQFKLVEKFDVNALADQLVKAGADYFVVTMYQNSGYFNAPNKKYNEVTGYKPGEKCAERDLILDIYNAIHPKGIKLLVYITGQVPNRDERAQKAFGLQQGKNDQLVDLQFAEKWAAVFQEWSDRYGDKVVGWWIDGCYRWCNFNEEIASLYSRALKHGNPNAAVAFNPGVCRKEWKTSDWTAGEINLPFTEANVQSQYQDGSQSQILTFLGNKWGTVNTRFDPKDWAKWIQEVNSNGGTVTFDMGPNWLPKNGPIGTFSPEQMEQIQTIRTIIRKK